MAVDLTEDPPAAVDRAAGLPVTSGSTVTLFHVLAPGADPAGAHERLVALTARLRPHLAADVRVEVALGQGVAGDAIVARAHDERAELVVMGRHRHPRRGEALLGTTAERVFHHGTTPVLLVAGAPAQRYRRALVAVDLSETSRAATELALRLLGEDAEVRVLHADDGRANDVTTAVLRFLEPYEHAGVSWDVVDRRGDPRAVVLADAAAWNPDLLVLGSHGHSKAVQKLVGGVADAVVRGATHDVLVARRRA